METHHIAYRAKTEHLSRELKRSTPRTAHALSDNKLLYSEEIWPFQTPSIRSYINACVTWAGNSLGTFHGIYSRSVKLGYGGRPKPDSIIARYPLYSGRIRCVRRFAVWVFVRLIGNSITYGSVITKFDCKGYQLLVCVLQPNGDRPPLHRPVWEKKAGTTREMKTLLVKLVLHPILQTHQPSNTICTSYLVLFCLLFILRKFYLTSSAGDWKKYCTRLAGAYFLSTVHTDN